MLGRLLYAYGMAHSLMGTFAAVVLGLLVQEQILGVTRQPLPLVWPVMVLHVVVAQLSLPDLFGPIETVADRSHVSRSIRASFCLLLIAVGATTYVAARGDRALLTFLLLLAALGFVAGALVPIDPWAWTLGVGLLVVGVVFVTPEGTSVSSSLREVPVTMAAASTIVSALGYAFQQQIAVGHRRPMRRR